MTTPSHRALRRLMTDQEEMLQSPVANVSAVPLDSDMFEWHCNIQQDKFIYHMVLYFPQNYPYSSPSAEFVPRGFNYNKGATKFGKKGDQICLSIFSDFATSHTEWTNQKGTGWSPGYTAQTVLLNVISFLTESNISNASDAKKYQELCQSFHCEDCGHTFDQPYPCLKTVQEPQNAIRGVISERVPNETQDDIISTQIVDYSSKEKFQPSRCPTDAELFGYGLVVTQRGSKHIITTPCEFLTSASFRGMQKSLGVVHSVMKEQLSYFLPLYINKTHGARIKDEFEATLRSMKHLLFSSKGKKSYAQIILELIPNLMCSTVVDFSKGSQHTSDNSLQGYFALHHLFLWAMDIYPELEAEVNQRLSLFVSNPQGRTKDSCPSIGQWLMLLSVSNKFTWETVADAYLSESFKRSVMWYLKTDKLLGYTSTSETYRLQRTFELTAVSRELLAFEVAFLDIAKPKDMSREQIVERYEANFGFPSPGMVSQMKTACEKIKSEIQNYGQWYLALGLASPSHTSLNKTLKESVIYAKSTPGYFFTPRPDKPKLVTHPVILRNYRKETLLCTSCYSIIIATVASIIGCVWYYIYN